MKRAKTACPCGAAEYRACCAPFHEGAEPPDPERLVRTRFSAFALGEVEYLWRTLDARHELRSQERDAVLRSLRTSSRSARYRSLEIHESKIDGDRASVLFTARIFVQGRDRSFVELAFFARSGGAWRYLDGITLPPDRIAEKTIARFEALIEARG